MQHPRGHAGVMSADARAAEPPGYLSSELLGFPADARVLIINCDDLGMHSAINTAVLEAVRDGIATSCSLMVTPPAAAQALRLSARRRGWPSSTTTSLTASR